VTFKVGVWVSTCAALSAVLLSSGIAGATTLPATSATAATTTAPAGLGYDPTADMGSLSAITRTIGAQFL